MLLYKVTIITRNVRIQRQVKSLFVAMRHIILLRYSQSECAPPKVIQLVIYHASFLEWHIFYWVLMLCAAVLTETHYRTSTLMQGSLKVPWLVNTQLLDRYEELVKTIYCEPGDTQILGCIFGDEMSLLSQPSGVSVANTQANKSKSKEVASKRKWKTLDIRDMLRQPATNNQQSGPTTNKVIVIDLIDAD